MNWVEFLLLLIPAYVANSSPVLFSGTSFLKRLEKPIDGGRSWQGNRLLGDGKTFKGLIVGVAAGLVAGFLLGEALTGFLLGLGAMLGDGIGSFIKRRFGIKRGNPHWLLDQETFIVFAFGLASLVARVMWEYWALALIITPPIHRLTNIIANKLDLKKVPF